MIRSVNHISLYRKIDPDMFREAGVEAGIPQFFYNTTQGMKEIAPDETFENILAINEYDTEWTPNEQDLIVRQNFRITNPEVLFGENGVTMRNNKIGLAAHIHSKTSSIQKTINFGSITSKFSKTDIQFEHIFPKDSLRGNVELDFFMYLQELNDTRPHQANQVGMVLSGEDLFNLLIITDGEGSAFPITEFSERNGPLWLLEKKWADAADDSFDSSNVSLRLNVSHPLFEQVKAGKTKASRALMGDIMVQAMSMIIQQVLIIEDNSLDTVDEVYSTSILAVVKYWVTTFEVDTSTPFTIMNSLRRTLDQQMLGGDGND